jgi:hypothetical protein
VHFTTTSSSVQEKLIGIYLYEWGDPENMAYENWILIKEHGICETCIFIIIKLTRGREREKKKEKKKERDCFNYF